MKQVRFCRDARIVESWCALSGSPGPVKTGEAGYILTRCSTKHKDIQLVPAARVIQTPANPESTPPFWSHEVRWNNGKAVARFGHRFLGIHRLYDPDNHLTRYSTYEKEIAPVLNDWLEILREAHPDSALPIAGLQFGYVNRFPFDLDRDNDLDSRFNLRYGLKTPANLGLGGVDLTFHLGNEDTRVRLNFSSSPVFPTTSKLSFVVKVAALRNYNTLSLSQR